MLILTGKARTRQLAATLTFLADEPGRPWNRGFSYDDLANLGDCDRGVPPGSDWHSHPVAANARVSLVL